MPAQKFTFRPGINTEATALSNEQGWSLSQLVRFFQGYLQKYGGWLRLSDVAVFGTARNLLSWEDANANPYLIIGTEQALELYFAGVIYNITPVESTSTVTPNFTTVSASNVVTVTDTGNPGAVGNYIYILNSIAVGGLVLQGSYVITNVIDGDNYEIETAVAATVSDTNTGVAAEFDTTMSSATTLVTLPDHGLIVGATFIVHVSTDVGGVTLFGAYSVLATPTTDTFTITTSVAVSTANGFENGGDVTLQYLLPSGLVSSQGISGLYGAGVYGAGVYGSGAAEAFVAARIWTFGYWGTDVVASPANGGLYTWISENGLTDNPATLIATAPLNINAGVFTAMPQQQIIALGASDGGGSDLDQMLVRWSDIADNTSWTATAINQAGSFRIPRGARIVGGFQGPQAGLIWTDVGLWLMQYIGFPLVYGFTEIAQGCGLIGPNAKGVLAGKVYWMSYNGFFVYDGNSIQPIPCPIWDEIFQNLNQFQTIKVIGCPNSFFNEMSWCYPSLSGSGENDSRVTLNTTDGTWTFDPPGAIIRTAWLDQSTVLNPIGIDENGIIQQHENGNDADGQPMVSYAQTGFMKLGAGEDYTFLERIIPDAILENNAALRFTFYFQNYPNGGIRTIGPLNYTQASKWLIIRGRGRLVSMKIGSSDLGSFWRYGQTLGFGQSAGRR